MGISDYQILCDNTNNTIDTIDRHELHCKVGIIPINAVEWIVIDLNLRNGDIGIREG